MKKRGFTLIELLGTILILSAIVLIISPLIINQINKGKNVLDEQTKDSIIMAAKNWASEHKNLLPTEEPGSIYVSELQKNGYLIDNIEGVSGNDCVVITNEDGAYYYKYVTEGSTFGANEEICPSTSIKKYIKFDAQTNGGYILENGHKINSFNIQGYPGAEKDITNDVHSNYESYNYNFIGWSAKVDGIDTDIDIEPVTKYIIPKKTAQTYYAIFKRNQISYTLTTNGNGGTGSLRTSSCTIPISYNYKGDTPPATSCTAFLPENSYTKQYYEFVGWNTNKNASSGEKPGNTVTLGSNQTYYAVWKQTTFKVTYDYSTNGGSSSTVTSKMVKIGNQVDLSPTASKSGWTFIGWNTDKNAKTALSSYTMPEKNVTLYAIYKKSSKSYTLTTNGNGGTGSARSSSCTIPAVYNNEVQSTSCTAILPSNTFTRSGYNFNGFSTSSSASSGASPGSAVSLSSNKTYYATWKKKEVTKTAYFYINGTRRYTKTCNTTGSGCNITLPTPSSSYIPSGYVFRGWSTSSSASSGTSAGASVYISASTTYYYAALAKENVYPSCSISISGGLKKTANGISWYYSGSPTVTLKTTNASSYSWTDANGSRISGKTDSFNYDVEGGYYNATVTSSTGNRSTCSLKVYRDTKAPKIFLSLNDPNYIVDVDEWGITHYAEIKQASNTTLNGGTYNLGTVMYRVVVVDYINPNAYLPEQAEQTGGYGSGLKTPIVMDYGSGTSDVYSPTHYDRTLNQANYRGTLRIDHYKTIDYAGNRTLRFTAQDMLGHSRTVTLNVNVV